MTRTTRRKHCFVILGSIFIGFLIIVWNIIFSAIDTIDDTTVLVQPMAFSAPFTMAQSLEGVVAIAPVLFVGMWGFAMATFLHVRRWCDVKMHITQIILSTIILVLMTLYAISLPMATGVYESDVQLRDVAVAGTQSLLSMAFTSVIILGAIYFSIFMTGVLLGIFVKRICARVLEE